MSVIERLYLASENERRGCFQPQYQGSQNLSLARGSLIDRRNIKSHQTSHLKMSGMVANDNGVLGQQANGLLRNTIEQDARYVYSIENSWLKEHGRLWKLHDALNIKRHSERGDHLKDPWHHAKGFTDYIDCSIS